MDCQDYFPCHCVGSVLPCTIQERPDPHKNYSQPLSIDTSLQYSRPGVAGGSEGVGLLMLLVIPAPPEVTETQTVTTTTTIVQGSQKSIPSEERYDPYLSSGYTQLQAVPHNLHPQSQEYLLHEDDLDLKEVTSTSDEPDHACNTNEWAFHVHRNGEQNNMYNAPAPNDLKICHVEEEETNRYTTSAGNHLGGQYNTSNCHNDKGLYPTVYTTDRYGSDRYGSSMSDRYWECSNDSCDTTDSNYWSQQTQYNFPDYDILSHSYGNTTTGKAAPRTVYDDYTESYVSGSTNSSVRYSTSCHMIRMDQYAYNSTDTKKSMGMVGRHCGQMAGRLITPDFFKSNIYAEEWIMNH